MYVIAIVTALAHNVKCACEHKVFGEMYVLVNSLGRNELFITP